MKNILVPIDFTPQTEAALQHALIMADRAIAKITLLHMVKELKEREPAYHNLSLLAEKYRFQIRDIEVEVRVGKIEDIGLVAEEKSANIVYLGTHGLKGLQFVFGSKALQVINKSKIPYIIVQAPPVSQGIKNIVVPMDGTVEEKQILHPVIDIAREFGSKLHLFGAAYDDEFLRKKTELNLQYTQKVLEKNKINYVSFSRAPKKSFLPEMIGYATGANADLIAIINHKEDGFKNLFGTHFDQAIITNEAKIPVLVINFKQIYHVVDLFTGMTKV